MRVVKELRTLAVHHTGSSDRLALRQGRWVLVDRPSGDNAKQEPEWFREHLGVIPHNQPVELFNLKDDPQQTRNLAGEFPEKVQQMKHLLEELEQSGRSRRWRGQVWILDIDKRWRGQKVAGSGLDIRH